MTRCGLSGEGNLVESSHTADPESLLLAHLDFPVTSLLLNVDNENILETPTSSTHQPPGIL